MTLFDNDGSEILQSVTIEGLPDDYTLEFGAFDPFAGSGINTDPGAWVINRSDSTAAADFLDRLVAGTDALTLIANPDPDFVTDFALMITATVSEAGSTPPTNNSWPIFVNFGDLQHDVLHGYRRRRRRLTMERRRRARPAALPPVSRCPLVG